MNKYKINDNLKFNYAVDKFADIEVLKYLVTGYDKLNLKQKEYIYY